MLNKKKIEKTHDLGELLDDCIATQNDRDFEDLRANCKLLTRYKIDFSYPSPIPEAISIEEAKAAIEKARRIRDFVMKKAAELGYYQD